MTTRTDKLSAVVMGAGPAGALCALMLAQNGLAVTLIERDPAPVNTTPDRPRRSINLSLSPRGRQALARGGVHAAALADAVQMRGRILHTSDNSTTLIRYGDRGWYNLSVGRDRLTELLRARASQHGVTLRLDTSCDSCDPDAGLVTLTSPSGSEQLRADLIVIAQGARSASREAFARAGLLRSTTTTAALGYKELMLGTPGAWFPFEPEAIHIWPRRGFFMVGLPNHDGTFRATLVLPHRDSPMSFASIRPTAFAGFFRRHFPDAAPHAHRVEAEYRDNPVGHIVLAESSHYAIGRAALVGDAAHAMAPFLGQGVNAAFEDITCMIEALQRARWDIPLALRRYADARRPDGLAAARLSMDNYDELAQRETSRAVALQKQLRAAAHQLLPSLIDPPTVILVNFLDLPYSQVLARS
jgi:kynurenine 3-monooxygenase